MNPFSRNQRESFPPAEKSALISESFFCAAQHLRMAVERLIRPDIPRKRVRAMAEEALERLRLDAGWSDVLLELITYHFNVLDEDIIKRMEKIHPVALYLKLFQEEEKREKMDNWQELADFHRNGNPA